MHVVVLNNCYAIASQRGEAAKIGRLLDDVFRVDHKRLENFRQRFSSLYWTFRPGQLLQSALWAACIRKKQLGGQTSLLKRVACTPDRGDVCIMQGQIEGGIIMSLSIAARDLPIMIGSCAAFIRVSIRCRSAFEKLNLIVTGRGGRPYDRHSHVVTRHVDQQEADRRTAQGRNRKRIFGREMGAGRIGASPVLPFPGAATSAGNGDLFGDAQHRNVLLRS